MRSKKSKSKSKDEVELEGIIEAITNAQKCPHLDTGGRGDHIPLAVRVRAAGTLQEASDILVDYEDMRMTAVRAAQEPRLEMVKRKLRNIIRLI